VLRAAALCVTVHPMINVEVKRNQNENAASLIRRFSRRVKGSGILPRLRGAVTYNRKDSRFRRKQSALKSIERKAERERLKKLGKLSDK